jgi:hypothetical protein
MKKQKSHRAPNFKSDDGRWFLVRCYECEPERGTENYGAAVSSGICYRCGYDANKKDIVSS